MKKLTLLDRAWNDISHASRILTNSTDDMSVDLAAYLTQQAMEKLIKYSCVVNGVRPKFGHDNELQLRILRENQLPYNPKLDVIADTITKWEAKTRYGEDIVATRSAVLEVLGIAITWYRELTTGIYPNS